MVADVTQPEQVQRFVQTAIERYGGIDVFFANAGIEGVVAPITDYPDDVFDRVMAVNVRGVWLGLKYVMAQMQQRGGGSIIITSSIAGVRGSPAGPLLDQQARRHRPDAQRRAGRRRARHPGQHDQPGPDRDADDAIDRGGHRPGGAASAPRPSARPAAR